MIQSDPANPWTVPASGYAQPGLTILLGYLIAAYGGSSNGIYVDRPMRGSRRPSLHRDGRALDWLQPDDTARARGALFCAEQAELLQVQEIHRYKESLAWNPTEGWHHATGEAFGEPWANWIHVERNLAGSADTRSIDEILHAAQPAPIEDEDMAEHYFTNDTGAIHWWTGSRLVPLNNAEMRGAIDASRKAQGLPALVPQQVKDKRFFDSAHLG